ncbi:MULTISPECIES: hypothetical protein [unclassified Pseudomonas]|nr:MULTISPECIES: hypothetical protein [unclassified Pseudomonas]MEB0090357.1 hypothetical protein [Pseudomonas sp. CCI4.2]MEB0120760.1 hypothetical protein [Pseudomonas sp. CCI1.2]WPX63234.1 hypothetical protein RHM59_20375 [Pseudomonas sp. MH10]
MQGWINPFDDFQDVSMQLKKWLPQKRFVMEAAVAQISPSIQASSNGVRLTHALGARIEHPHQWL